MAKAQGLHKTPKAMLIISKKSCLPQLGGSSFEIPEPYRATPEGSSTQIRSSGSGPSAHGLNSLWHST